MKQHSELQGVESTEMWNPAFDWCSYLKEFLPRVFALVRVYTDYNVKKNVMMIVPHF